MFEELFSEIKQFSQPATVEEANRQLGVICEAIEKCEKILQHLAVANMNNSSSSGEMDSLISQHMELIKIKDQLVGAKASIKNSEINNGLNSEVANSRLNGSSLDAQAPNSGSFFDLLKNLFNFRNKSRASKSDKPDNMSTKG